MDLVLLGNMLVDDVVFEDGRTRMQAPGGAVLYGALGAALWGLRVGVVSVLGSDYPQWAIAALVERGVDLAGARPLGRAGMRTWLLYEGRLRRVVHRLEGPTHADVSPGFEAIPSAWRDARAFHVAPMPFESQAALVERLAGQNGALLSLDPYLLVDAETLPAWQGLAARVDAFFLSEDELLLPGAADEPRPLLAALARGRLRSLLLKRGARGGLLLDAGAGRFHEWPGRAAQVVDPTGAGDAFASGVLAGWLRGESHERALWRGVVGASFAIQDWGVGGLLAASPAAAEARLREWSGV